MCACAATSLQRERLGDVLVEPLQQRPERLRPGTRDGLRVLRLAAGAVRRADQDPRDVVRVGLALVLAEHVEAQVHRREHPAGGQDLAVVDVHRVLDEVHAREGGAELVSERPVRGDPAAVEHPGLAEDEGASTQRHHPRAGAGRARHRLEHGRVLRRPRRLQPRHDDGVGAADPVDRLEVGDGEARARSG